MGEDTLENIKQNFQIHYCFDDDSHSMNAFIRNAMERDLLGLISEVGKTLNIDIQINSEAKKEGSLIDAFILLGGSLLYLKPSINQILAYYLTDGFHKNKEMILKNALKKEELKRSKLQTQRERQEIESKTLQEYNLLESNHKINRHISNFYKKAKGYEKIRKIGYQFNHSSELVVTRDQFSSFIFDQKKDNEIIEDAEVEIISPVLKEGKYKWRGIYNGAIIDFSMGDNGFKKDIINQKHNFINGTTISCQLEISKTFDNYGEEIKTLYRVKKVYNIKTNDIVKITEFGQKRMRQKEEAQEQNLFTLHNIQ